MVGKYVEDDSEVSQKEFNSLNFGISVLKWLNYDEKPKHKNLKDELLAEKVDPYNSANNKQYMDEELYENYKEQALIKIQNHPHEYWSLNEMLSMKVYTDATAFQTVFRRSFWKLLHDDHELAEQDKVNKKQYYWWALNLYRAALFHAKPVPRPHDKTTSPCTIFHGLNNVFIVDEQLPIYNGPISTTLAKTVAHTFSEEKGLLWTITPSYTNQFRFIVGIQVDWISHFKAEAEILLVNQYLPIGSTQNFEENSSNKVDQLMLQLQKFKHEITNKHRFFKQIGFAIKNDDHEMIALISKHVSLFARCKYKNTIVLRRLITELEVPLPDLEDLLTIHESYVFAEVLTKHLVLHEDKFISLDNMSDIDEKYIKEILDMKFIVVENSNQSHIKNVGNRHVYKFADIREWYMLIPFKQDKDVFSVYVRTEQIFSFLLLKTFTIKSSTHEVTNETRLLKQYKMNHLLTTLKVLNFKIVNDELFYRQIGCVIVSDCIAIIKRKTSLLYASTVFGQNTVLHRLVEELKITILSNLLKVYLSKWEYFGGYSVFNYCSYKLRINVNYGAAQTDFLFQNCEYRLVHDSDHQNINNRIISNFNQEMVIKNTYSVIQNTNVVSNAYTVYVRNAALFGVNDWVVLQHLDIDFGEYTNLFLADLYLMHNQLVTLKQKRDVALGGDDGEYDLVTTASKHRIYAKSNRPTVRASVALYTLHWYFEVHIIKKQADQHVWIGFANADFKPNDKKRMGVGCDINSWASNGSTTLHGNETSNTRLREWMEGDIIGICIDLKGDIDERDHKFIAYHLNGRFIDNMKFTWLRRCFGVYPCISLDRGTVIDIVFDQHYFAQTVPDQFRQISFKSNTVFQKSIHQKYHHAMFEARYLTRTNQTQLNIKSDSVDEARIYEFTATQLNFIVPFSTNASSFSVYVQPNREAEFTLLKTFVIGANDGNKLTYLLTMLKTYNAPILNPNRFYQQIGFEMLVKWINSIKISKLAYQPTVLSAGSTVMRRVMQELGYNVLSGLCNVYEMKFEMVAAHKAFNYSTFKMKTNDTLAPQLSKCEYRMYTRRNYNDSDYKTSVELSYEAEIPIRNRFPYVIEIKNGALFGFNTFIELQTICTKNNDFSNTFAESLRVQDDKQIVLEQNTDDHGVFDLTITSTGYQVSNIQNYALICANTRLSKGKYYYEVHVNDTVGYMTSLRIGWSNAPFLSMNRDAKECGNSAHSWAWNGRSTFHNRLMTPVWPPPRRIRAPMAGDDVLKESKMSANVSYYFKPGDIIGCSIDIDQGQIKYYSNNEDLGIAFDEIRFGNAEVFPCISYRREGYTVYAILDLEIVCEPHSFKCDAIPTGHSPIPCVDRNCLFIQSQNMLRMYNSDVLSSKYTMVHTEKALKPQLEDQSANIYQFDDIDDICFIVPLIREPENVGIYVQPQAGFNFTLIRTFRVNPNHQFKTEDQCSNEIEYLLKTLNNWKHTITNPVTFIEHVGVTLTAKHTDVLTQQAKDLSFPSMPLGATLTQRLVSELDIQCLSNYLKVLLSTFDVAGHAFNFCAITMNPNKMYGENGGSELEWFGRYQYKLSSNTDDVMVAYNDQIQIDASNEYHIDLVAKHNSLQIQTIKPLAIQPSTSFVDNLVLTDDKIVFTLHADSVNGVHRKAILNAIYLMVYQDEIDSEATMTESDGVIYQFDDINQLRFIIPFDTETQHAHLYV
eukprot:261309_1